jgi:hypothetical protein
MQDRLVKSGSTSRIVKFALRSSSTGQLVTGKVHSDFSGTYSSAGGTSTALSFSSGTAGDSYTSGKIAPIGNGTYDWHVPDTVFASAGQIIAKLSCADALDVVFDWQVVTVDRDTARFGAPTAVENRTEMDSNSTQLAAIVEDTGTTLPSTLSGIETKVDTVDGVVDDILVDTGTTLPASLTSISSAITVVDGIVDDILVDTSTTLPATLSGMETKIDTVDTVVDTLTTSLTGVETKIDTIDGIVDSILVDTGTTLPASLSGLETKVDTIDGIVDDILVDTGTTLPATLTTIDTELGQVLDRAGYCLTILAGATSTAGTATEQYDLTIDSVAYRAAYAGLDANGNRGTTTLSKP